LYNFWYYFYGEDNKYFKALLVCYQGIGYLRFINQLFIKFFVQIKIYSLNLVFLRSYPAELINNRKIFDKFEKTKNIYYW